MPGASLCYTFKRLRRLDVVPYGDREISFHYQRVTHFFERADYHDHANLFVGELDAKRWIFLFFVTNNFPGATNSQDIAAFEPIAIAQVDRNGLINAGLRNCVQQGHNLTVDTGGRWSGDEIAFKIGVIYR